MKLERIDIDWDIHKMIEAERNGFDEPAYIALRRLLKLPASAQAQTEGKGNLDSGIPWTDEGVVVPHGSSARMEYLRGSQVYEGQFVDGKLVVSGRSFQSLSAAADAVAVTKSGSKTSLNGWIYWKAKFPSENKWRSLDAMRQAAKGSG